MMLFLEIFATVILYLTGAGLTWSRLGGWALKEGLDHTYCDCVCGEPLRYHKGGKFEDLAAWTCDNAECDESQCGGRNKKIAFYGAVSLLLWYIIVPAFLVYNFAKLIGVTEKNFFVAPTIYKTKTERLEARAADNKKTINILKQEAKETNQRLISLGLDPETCLPVKRS